MECASNVRALKQLKVTHVLNAAYMEQSAYHPQDFKYKILNAADDQRQNLADMFEMCFEFIDAAIVAGGSILVHW